MKKVLILSGHPNLDESFANKAILNELAKSAPEFEIRRLDLLYPDFIIDVVAEQAKLVEADIIVWQFPIQWFSAPAIFKRWQDEVLTYGFAYGSTGTFLQGKRTVLSVTVGGEEKDYAHGEPFKHTIDEFLVPLAESIPYCNMVYAGRVYSGDMTYIKDIFPEKQLKIVEEKAVLHAKKLIEIIKNIE